MQSSPLSLTSPFRREWGWFVLLGLALGLLLAAGLWADRRDIELRERERLAQGAQTVHDNLGEQLGAVNRVLESLIGDWQHLQGAPDRTARAQRRLQAFATTMTGVRTMVLLDANGVAVAASREELMLANYAHRAYFLAARQSAPADSLVVTPPFRTTLGVWAIVLARVVPAPDGSFGGVVVATLDPEHFQTLLRSVRFAPDVVSAIAHGDGVRFLMMSDRDAQSGANLAQPGTLFTRHSESGALSNVFKGAILPGGEPYLMAMNTVRPSALHMDKPLVVAVGRDWHAMFAPWRSKVQVLGGAYLLTGLAAAGGLAFLQRRRRQLWRQERALTQRGADMEARWRAVLEATNQGVWDWDATTNKVFFSPVWKVMLGYTEAEIGDSLDEWASRLHPEDWERVQADVQRHLRGETPFYENVHRVCCKDGSYKWILDRGRVVERDDRGKPLRLIGTHTDVTEQHATREKIDRLVENVPGVLYQYLRRADGSDCFPYASQGMQDIYGCPPEAVRDDATPVFQRIHPDDLQRVSEGIAQSARTQLVWRDDYRVVLPGVGERWLSGQARPQHMPAGAVLWHGYIQDVTDAKRQALQLQENERLLQHLMNEMPIGLCQINGAGTLYYRNRRFVELFGYTEAEVSTMEQWWLRAYPDPVYRAQLTDAWQTAMKGITDSGVIPELECLVTTLDGVQRTVAISGITFASHALATFVDVSEQKAQKDALEKLAYLDGQPAVLRPGAAGRVATLPPQRTAAGAVDDRYRPLQALQRHLWTPAGRRLPSGRGRSAASGDPSLARPGGALWRRRVRLPAARVQCGQCTHQGAGTVPGRPWPGIAARQLPHHQRGHHQPRCSLPGT